MARKRLSRERVIEAAVQLIEESGKADFSMKALPDFLDVKTASLCF